MSTVPLKIRGLPSRSRGSGSVVSPSSSRSKVSGGRASLSPASMAEERRDQP